jgi:hypothetical protein
MLLLGSDKIMWAASCCRLQKKPEFSNFHGVKNTKAGITGFLIANQINCNRLRKIGLT